MSDGVCLMSDGVCLMSDGGMAYERWGYDL